MSQPTCWIIAGPNGAGKTTFALETLPGLACRSFVNADLIAAGLSPLAPERELAAASRLFLREIAGMIAKRESFGFETTWSGLTHLRRARQLIAAGWRVELIYLALPDVGMSISRVAERVAHGGHSVPEAVIRRRFPRSLRNLLYHYGEAVTTTRCFMNTNQRPEMVYIQTGTEREVINRGLFDHLVNEAQP